MTKTSSDANCSTLLKVSLPLDSCECDNSIFLFCFQHIRNTTKIEWVNTSKYYLQFRLTILQKCLFLFFYCTFFQLKRIASVEIMIQRKIQAVFYYSIMKLFSCKCMLFYGPLGHLCETFSFYHI